MLVSEIISAAYSDKYHKKYRKNTMITFQLTQRKCRTYLELTNLDFQKKIWIRVSPFWLQRPIEKVNLQTIVF